MLQRRLDLIRSERFVKTAPTTGSSDPLLSFFIDIGRHKYHRNRRRSLNLLGGLDSIHITLQADIHQHYVRALRQRFLDSLHP